MNQLKQVIMGYFGANVWQCEEFPTVDRVQIVLLLEPKKRWFPTKPLQLLDSYSRAGLLEMLHKALSICKQNKIERDLRIAFKLKSGLTVSTMLFSKASVLGYEESQDLETIAQEWHIVSGLR